MNGFCLLCWAMVARRREASRYTSALEKGILGGIGTMGSTAGAMGDDPGPAGGGRRAA